LIRLNYRRLRGGARPEVENETKEEKAKGVKVKSAVKRRA
jgi:hypothetical protein